jgi:hypothetical protein
LVIGKLAMEWNEEKTSDWLRIHGSTTHGSGATPLAHRALIGAKQRRRRTPGLVIRLASNASNNPATGHGYYTMVQ